MHGFPRHPWGTVRGTRSRCFTWRVSPGGLHHAPHTHHIPRPPFFLADREWRTKGATTYVWREKNVERFFFFCKAIWQYSYTLIYFFFYQVLLKRFFFFDLVNNISLQFVLQGFPFVFIRRGRPATRVDRVFLTLSCDDEDRELEAILFFTIYIYIVMRCATDANNVDFVKCEVKFLISKYSWHKIFKWYISYVYKSRYKWMTV